MMKVRKKTKLITPFIYKGLIGFLGVTTVKFKSITQLLSFCSLVKLKNNFIEKKCKNSV